MIKTLLKMITKKFIYSYSFMLFMNKNYIVRKVRENTNGTMIISLPKNYGKEIKLTPGDYVMISVKNDKIEIVKSGL